ncbi:hypothetical protein [Prochlorothrix hollandica]|uniref:hypothetical protein n=1 Tax=Prochlorothrix hollandica TaxID=1223 RepID=UPI0011D216A3|nr:hypothetical protein [Prochlorothrix hollandica]
MPWRLINPEDLANGYKSCRSTAAPTYPNRYPMALNPRATTPTLGTDLQEGIKPLKIESF